MTALDPFTALGPLFRNFSVTQSSEPLVLVDSHVHVYPQFDAARLLFSAHENFARQMRANAAPQAPWQGVLMLSETHACNWFERVREHGESEIHGWRMQSTGDDISLLATGPAQQRLHIVAGRQINSREGVEILTLASTVRIADGAPIESVVKQGLAAGALVVLPWGAGKWLGHRGRLVARTLQESARRGERVFAGDNGGRPSVWPRPTVFTESEARGCPVLPGTDPLPIVGCEARVGTYGFAMKGPLQELQTGLQLRQQLLAAKTLQPFGRGESLPGFVRSQLKLRLG